MGGSQAPLGKGVSMLIQNTCRRGDAVIRNKQNSFFSIAFGMRRRALVKGLFEDQAPVI